MLRRKYSIQKSFRIDAQLSEDLETLSEVLNRPQNDLVNTALEELMLQNKEWFIKDYLVDKFKIFFDHNISYEYKDSDISIDIEVDEKKQEVKMSYEIYLIEEKDQIVKELDDEGKATIKMYLRNFATFLNKNSTEIKTYLEERLNYK